MLSIFKTAIPKFMAYSALLRSSFKYGFSTLPPSNGANSDFSSLASDASSKISQSSSTVQGERPKLPRLSKESQKAVLAALIIKEIVNADPPKKCEKILYKKVLDLQNNLNHLGVDFQEQCKKQIFEMFSTGTENDPTVFYQRRIYEATQNSMIVFYPTYVVTRNIFLHILTSNHSRIFLGSFGIGKNFSFYLYSKLSKYINKLKYLATTPYNLKRQFKQNYQFEYQQLIKRKLIMVVPKCWYWSISNQLEEDFSKIKQLILHQTEEFCYTEEFKQQLEKCESLPELVDKINLSTGQDNRFFSFIALDQLNVMASRLRKLNYDLRNLYMEKTSLAEQKKIQGDKIHLKQYNQNITQFLELGHYYIASSSVHLQKDLIYNTHEDHKRKYLDLAGSEPQFSYICYGDKLKQEETQIEFCQLFSILVQQKCSELNLRKETIALIKQAFTIEQFAISYNYRLLFIREYLSTSLAIEMFREIQKQQSREKYHQLISKISESFYSFSIQYCKDKLRNYLKKPGETAGTLYLRRIIMLSIYTEALVLFQEGKKELIINASQLKHAIKPYIKAEDQSDIGDFLESGDFNNEEFPFVYNASKGIVSFDWMPIEFINIARSTLFPIDAEQQGKSLTMRQMEMYSERSETLGNAVEMHCMQILKSATSLKLQCFQQNNFETIQLQITSRMPFLAFNQGLAMNFSVKQPAVDDNPKQILVTACYSNNFGNLLKAAKERPNSTVYGWPTFEKKQNNQIKFSNKSECIDFVFIKYTPQKIYQITTVDICISNHQITTKIAKSREFHKAQLRKVKGNMRNPLLRPSQKRKSTDQDKKVKKAYAKQASQNHYMVNHIILCPAKSCRPPLIVADEKFKISFCSLQDIVFVGPSNNDEIVVTFRDFLKFLFNRWIQ